ncbi:tat pathway signal sequence protein [Rutstroemia sp. NJR-2017a WRK4]|nr:tat pathway signal sequence protein [Rutstroemia sp. NJR-2017a WRK4]
MFGAFRGYNKVNTDEEKEHSIRSSTESPSRCVYCEGHAHTRPRALFMLYLGWFLLLVLSAFVVFSNRDLRSSNTKQLITQTSSYSPILEDLDPGLQEFRFNGSIRWPSPYRGPPSKEVDAAWNRISIVRPLDLDISKEDFHTIGVNADTAATNAPEHGGGYFMVPEFTHQLHCVNLLRKASYFKYEYYKIHDPDFGDKEETFKVHLASIDHCVEMLRQFVMCHADVTIVTAHRLRKGARLDKQTFKARRDSVDPHEAGGCHGNEFAAMKYQWSGM